MVISIQIGITTLVGSSLADFTRALPQYQERLQILLQEFLAWLASFGLEITDQTIMDQLNPGKLMALVGNMLNNLLGMLKNTFLIMITFIFILLEVSGIPTKLKVLAGDRDDSLDRYSEIIQGVNKYLGLKTLTSMLTGFLAWGCLAVFGINYAVMWGLLAFVLNFVPTIGSIIAAIPPIMLALVQFGVGHCATITVLYLIINIGVSNFFEPRIMGSRVGLSALVIFMSMAFWGWVLGPVGMLLSVPLTMTLKIAMANSEKTKPIALLLGSNAEAAEAVRERIERRIAEDEKRLKKRQEGLHGQ